ncbi:ADL324Wp [Eremothecium gossypii ATCC 10895]|uniref:ADL324Wp n=1 Tax=Eremothecium gossypii (strain ATCC 10895 / CBS 109.51 / FGSC 9923 / NRRL Y-1056) TaxID=284811 RepID=Q75B94_EREGS|nr:ADL324Wp [Eremothecium gossypii ATCC 10895]AAS51596.1 ADL324Wp [Eremothecium gossypii ATCC 10895]AEY95892.1 FADL324Wp [Eremothecium gossypii FDAG1]
MPKRLRTEEYSCNQEDERSDSQVIVCNDPPCSGARISMHIYPSHVAEHHDNVCAACNKNMITERMLQLHLQELHDPFNSNKALECYEADCMQQFQTHSKRREHLITVHEYPMNARLDIVYTGYNDTTT